MFAFASRLNGEAAGNKFVVFSKVIISAAPGVPPVITQRTTLSEL